MNQAGVGRQRGKRGRGEEEKEGRKNSVEGGG